MMSRAVLILGLVAVGCAGRTQPPPCTGTELRALRSLYERAARQVIDSGACDEVQRVENCAEYMVVEVNFRLAAKGMCQR